jgi:hypothetical protein
VTVTAPGTWALAKPVNAVTLEKAATGWMLTVPIGVHTVELITK